jgi:predicted DNA-binding protein (MmcQ/YjbR family)
MTGDTTTVRASDVERAVRELALGLPEAYEDRPWGHPVFKLPPNRVFCFLSEGEEPTRVTTKLSQEEREIALSLPWCSVARYVGRYGWVTGRIEDDDTLDSVREWILESYWLRATPRQRELLEASPVWTAA